MTKYVKLREGETEHLLKRTEEKPGQEGAVTFSFGPGGVWIDAEEEPEVAKHLQDYRDCRDSNVFSDGGGI